MIVCINIWVYLMNQQCRNMHHIKINNIRIIINPLQIHLIWFVQPICSYKLTSRYLHYCNQVLSSLSFYASLWTHLEFHPQTTIPKLHTSTQLPQCFLDSLLSLIPFYLNILINYNQSHLLPPIETWSSILADVGTVSMQDGFANTLFSDTKAAQVYYGIMYPLSNPPLLVKNIGSLPSFNSALTNLSTLLSLRMQHLYIATPIISPHIAIY